MSLKNELLLPGWELDGDNNIKRVIDEQNYLIIHKYPYLTSQFCCHIIRGDFRYSPPCTFSLPESYSACDQHLSMPIEDFKQLIILDKIKELVRLHKELAMLGHEPTSSEYAAGYKEGFQDAKRELAVKVRDIIEETVAA